MSGEDSEQREVDAGNENDLERNLSRDVNLHGSSFHGTPSLLGDANDRALTDGGRTPRDVLPADLADLHNQVRTFPEFAPDAFAPCRPFFLVYPGSLISGTAVSRHDGEMGIRKSQERGTGRPDPGLL